MKIYSENFYKCIESQHFLKNEGLMRVDSGICDYCKYVVGYVRK
ncbi:hypothetical protein HFN_1565 [Helicobacter fennelliae MRY12-0050]|uniref:Uncharacterized protein n=1 Tax=Helicobacter fennelliae MRY12-0050 TaxID=1325130 RepID=T1CYI6_9HELI|nr:hypothetical protein HFN_1565 [Helicobacter fennelliae MRY12-0050]